MTYPTTFGELFFPEMAVSAESATRFLNREVQIIMEGDAAYEASLCAEMAALDKTSLSPWQVATNVALEAQVRRAAELDAAEVAAWEPNLTKLKKPGLLGCWVDGKLRFQSRDHDAVRGYAADKMSDKRNTGVWVAPVGSFIDGKAQS